MTINVPRIAVPRRAPRDSKGSRRFVFDCLMLVSMVLLAGAMIVLRTDAALAGMILATLAGFGSARSWTTNRHDADVRVTELHAATPPAPTPPPA